MTVYSGVLGRTHALKSVREDVSIHKVLFGGAINKILLLGILLVIAVYVLLANIVASQVYFLNQKKNELYHENARMAERVNNIDSINLILNFAKETGMVEAKDSAILVKENPIALQRDSR